MPNYFGRRRRPFPKVGYLRDPISVEWRTDECSRRSRLFLRYIWRSLKLSRLSHLFSPLSIKLKCSKRFYSFGHVIKRLRIGLVSPELQFKAQYVCYRWAMLFFSSIHEWRRFNKRIHCLQNPTKGLEEHDQRHWTHGTSCFNNLLPAAGGGMFSLCIGAEEANIIRILLF